ncbi:MAG TPA: SAM-dependent chlorinase/fluorinase [Gammaproteobacteria bacterium]|jgi:S-adenosylmethionine hydrolase
MSNTFSPSGCITLTTDFGADSPFVGVMKAVIWARFPQARIVDLFHGVAPYDTDEGGFWLGRTYHWSAPGTVHVAVVDPGVGSSRRIIAARHAGHVFLAPDNGLLVQAFSSGSDGVEYRVLDIDSLPGIELPFISATFHGRDIFAPVAAWLASGRYRFESLGPSAESIAGAKMSPARLSAGRIEGTVVSIDRYGNLISNIDGSLLEGRSSSRVACAGGSFPWVKTYSEAATGELVALINSLGVVEIACTQGHAAGRLGIQRGAVITIHEAEDAL